MNLVLYSYRTDPNVPTFPDDKSLLVFDGVCVLCTGFARYVLETDKKQFIRLCSAQSPLGQALYRHYGLDPVHYETNIFIRNGVAQFKSDAFVGAMTAMGWPYSLARGLKLCPRFIRDGLYNPVARNRYRWFGERNSCYVPDASERDRFVS